MCSFTQIYMLMGVGRWWSGVSLMSYNRAQKAPWPPVLRDSTTGNQEARLPRSESAGASHTTFSRVVGNGSQLFRINIIHGILLRMSSTVWESTPTRPALNPHRATERCRGKQHPDWRQSELWGKVTSLTALKEVKAPQGQSTEAGRVIPGPQHSGANPVGSHPFRTGHLGAAKPL